MNTLLVPGALSVLLALPGPVPPATAQTNPPSRKPVVLGTTQLPGDFGQFGTTYTIGKDNPINITLRSAQYSVVPIHLGDKTYVPRADQKLLVLRYTVHNPLPQEQTYTWWSLRFTAVDAQDRNYEAVQSVGREGTTEPLAIALKPAQKVDVFAALLVPAAGVVPKLLIEREKGAPVIRYDLRGKVAPLPAEVADAADPQGASARPEVAVAAGAFAPLGVFDARLDQTGYTTEPQLRRQPGPGKRYFRATLTLRNRSAATQRYGWTDFAGEVRDTDGEKTLPVQTLVKATRDEVSSGTLAPDEAIQVRFLFLLPETATARTLRLGEGKIVHRTIARTFLFEVDAARPVSDSGKEPQK